MNKRLLIIILTLTCVTRRVDMKNIKDLKDAKENGFDCFARGGREIFLKVSKQEGSYLQSIEQSTGKTVNHKSCITFDDGDVYCQTWHIRDIPNTKKAYKFKALDHKGNVLWEGEKEVVPREALFYCYHTHDIKNLKVSHDIGSSTGSGIIIKWDIQFWDQKFSPRHNVTINGKSYTNNGDNKLLNPINCRRWKCSLIIPTWSDGCSTGMNSSISNICVKTEFDLNAGEINRYKKRHMTTTCTVFKKTCPGVPSWRYNKIFVTCNQTQYKFFYKNIFHIRVINVKSILRFQKKYIPLYVMNMTNHIKLRLRRFLRLKSKKLLGIIERFTWSIMFS